jgi:hypothetical protein
MSAFSSQLTVTLARSLPAAPACLESTEPRPMPWTILHAIAEQVRALFLAQRSLSGQVGCAAYAAEDDYRRFSNR